MSHLRLRLIRLWHELLGSLWPIPLACLLGGIALALTTIAIDRRFDYRLVPAGLTGGPDAAETVLGTFATSLVTLTSLVLSLTLVAVQLAIPADAGQPGRADPVWSPRRPVAAGRRADRPGRRQHQEGPGRALPARPRSAGGS